MVPFGMIMVQVLANDMVEAPFTEYRHLIEGFLFDGAHEPFAMGIEIGAPGGKTIGSTPLALSKPSNACVNFVSLSRSRYRWCMRNPSKDRSTAERIAA